MREVGTRHFDELEKFGNIAAVNNQDSMNLLTEMNKKMDLTNAKLDHLFTEMKALGVCINLAATIALPETELTRILERLGYPMPDGTIEDKRKQFGNDIGLDWDI
ncbi:hypothetical protein E2P81_ATG11800 [Venturia nashicola]|nr:hypothetical protein E2P81_ATG11800 [Venturia nashicola]